MQLAVAIHIQRWNLCKEMELVQFTYIGALYLYIPIMSTHSKSPVHLVPTVDSYKTNRVWLSISVEKATGKELAGKSICNHHHDPINSITYYPDFFHSKLSIMYSSSLTLFFAMKQSTCSKDRHKCTQPYIDFTADDNDIAFFLQRKEFPLTY